MLADIGAGRGDRHARSLNKLSRHGMRRKAHRDGIPAARGFIGHGRQLPENHRQGAGAKGSIKQGGLLGRMGNAKDIFPSGKMHDQGIIRRASFDGIDLSARIAVESIPAESVHRFGGECDELAFTQQFGCLYDVLFCVSDLRYHFRGGKMLSGFYYSTNYARRNAFSAIRNKKIILYKRREI